MLCEALKASGFAGRPEEWFYNAWLGGYTKFAGLPAPLSDDPSPDELRESLAQLSSRGSSPNGVFGVKVMWNYWPKVVALLRRMLEKVSGDDLDVLRACLPQPRFLRISRRDRVAQAVSWAKGEQSGRFSSTQKAAGGVRLEYDYGQIRRHFVHINEAERGWDEFFESRRVEPFSFDYEDFVANYDQLLHRVLGYLEIEAPVGHVFKQPLERQADQLNIEWAERFRRDHGLVPAPDRS